MIGDVDIYDLEEYKKYMKKVKPMIERYSGDYLIRGGEIEALETKLLDTHKNSLSKISKQKGCYRFVQ